MYVCRYLCMYTITNNYKYVCMQLQKIRTPFVSTHIDHRAQYMYMYVRMYVVDLFFFYNVLQ